MYAIVVSFSTYFCMYAFRKPFLAATYKGHYFLGSDVELKSAFVSSQLIGYALSKVIGIKICSETKPGGRAVSLVAMILMAQMALLLFALLPNNLKVVAIFFNGLSLGMVWGMVVWYLEGRRTSEILLAGLSCSFILASGVVKDVGRGLMTLYELDPFMMPFATGLIFLPGFLLSVYFLNQIPPPDKKDVQARVERKIMDRRKRWLFLRTFMPGMLMLLVAYLLLTTYRDFRDSFGVELFASLGYGEGEMTIFTRSEMWVAFGVLVTLAGLSFIKDNRRGLIGAFVIMTFGIILMGAGTLLLDAGMISGFTWMILAGLGLYLAYVPYGSVLFDRMIASTRTAGTAVFAIYVADSVGYGGVVTVLLTKDLIASDVSRLDFFRGMSYCMSLIGLVLLVLSWKYFMGRIPPSDPSAPSA